MVHTNSLPPAWDLTLSHREGRFYTPPHSHRLSHVSSWRTEEKSYLMPCMTRRGHRNRLQNKSPKKFKQKSVSHHTLIWKIRTKLAEVLCLLLHPSNIAGFAVSVNVCAQEIITIFNILWHSNFIHVVRAMQRRKKDPAAFFTGSALLFCSFTYFHVSHILLASLPFSSLCPPACLSHSPAAVSILYSACYFWMKLSHRAASLCARLELDHCLFNVAAL